MPPLLASIFVDKMSRYNVAEKQLSFLERSGPLSPQDGKIQLQILVDRISIEGIRQRGEHSQ